LCEGGKIYPSCETAIVGHSQGIVHSLAHLQTIRAIIIDGISTSRSIRPGIKIPNIAKSVSQIVAKTNLLPVSFSAHSRYIPQRPSALPFNDTRFIFDLQSIMPLDFPATALAPATSDKSQYSQFIECGPPKRAITAALLRDCGYGATTLNLTIQVEKPKAKAAVDDKPPEEGLGKVLSDLFKVPGREMSNDDPIMVSGLTSVQLQDRITDLSKHVGRPLPSTIVYDFPSLRALEQAIAPKPKPVEIAPVQQHATTERTHQHILDGLPDKPRPTSKRVRARFQRGHIVGADKIARPFKKISARPTRLDSLTPLSTAEIRPSAAYSMVSTMSTPASQVWSKTARLTNVNENVCTLKPARYSMLSNPILSKVRTSSIHRAACNVESAPAPHWPAFARRSARLSGTKEVSSLKQMVDAKCNMGASTFPTARVVPQYRMMSARISQMHVSQAQIQPPADATPVTTSAQISCESSGVLTSNPLKGAPSVARIASPTIKAFGAMCASAFQPTSPIFARQTSVVSQPAKSFIKSRLCAVSSAEPPSSIGHMRCPMQRLSTRHSTPVAGSISSTRLPCVTPRNVMSAQSVVAPTLTQVVAPRTLISTPQIAGSIIRTVGAELVKGQSRLLTQKPVRARAMVPDSGEKPSFIKPVGAAVRTRIRTLTARLITSGQRISDNNISTRAAMKSSISSFTPALPITRCRQRLFSTNQMYSRNLISSASSMQQLSQPCQPSVPEKVASSVRKLQGPKPVSRAKRADISELTSVKTKEAFFNTENPISQDSAVMSYGISSLMARRESLMRPEGSGLKATYPHSSKPSGMVTGSGILSSASATVATRVLPAPRAEKKLTSIAERMGKPQATQGARVRAAPIAAETKDPVKCDMLQAKLAPMITTSSLADDTSRLDSIMPLKARAAGCMLNKLLPDNLITQYRRSTRDAAAELRTRLVCRSAGSAFIPKAKAMAPPVPAVSTPVLSTRVAASMPTKSMACKMSQITALSTTSRPPSRPCPVFKRPMPRCVSESSQTLISSPMKYLVPTYVTYVLTGRHLNANNLLRTDSLKGLGDKLKAIRDQFPPKKPTFKPLLPMAAESMSQGIMPFVTEDSQLLSGGFETLSTKPIKPLKPAGFSRRCMVSTAVTSAKPSKLFSPQQLSSPIIEDASLTESSPFSPAQLTCRPRGTMPALDTASVPAPTVVAAKWALVDAITTRPDPVLENRVQKLSTTMFSTQLQAGYSKPQVKKTPAKKAAFKSFMTAISSKTSEPPTFLAPRAKAVPALTAAAALEKTADLIRKRLRSQTVHAQLYALRQGAAQLASPSQPLTSATPLQFSSASWRPYPEQSLHRSTA